MLTPFRRPFAAVTVAAVLTLLPAAAPPLSAAPSPSMSLPVVGSAPGGAVFTGVFSLASFTVRNGQVVATGVITGVVTTAAGVATSVAQNVTMPVQIGQTSCQILHLDLGPIFLDVLGLQVDLSRIVLDITAQAGAGNLLGNLLCAVANLLNDPSGLARILNQILAALLG